jgi:hypothetical protein
MEAQAHHDETGTGGCRAAKIVGMIVESFPAGPGKERSMPNRFRRELGLLIAWVLFPLIPVLLEDMHYSVSNLEFGDSSRAAPDPHVWGWVTWVVVLGPLVGYGFLSGATLSIPDDPAEPRSRWRRLLARRAVWVAIGPWWGALVCVGVFFGLVNLEKLFPALFQSIPSIPESWKTTWAYWLISWAAMIFLVVIWAYSWLWPAASALRRAGRLREWRRSLVRGIVMAGAFVGSLFGSFWAATTIWRSYFFDSRVVPLLLIAVSLVLLSGCTSTITYGELRRRELFHAMLVAWVLGLALMWRWWSRARPGQPPAGAG